jgi:hypothetical protein
MGYGRALVLIFILSLVSAANAMDCSDIASSKPSDLVQFLKTQGREADEECVSQAIVRLGGFRTTSGIDVLIDLLDFQRPQSTSEKLHLFDPHDKFPAVQALFGAGLPAVPQLIRKLEDGRATEVVRANAIRTVVLIYRDDPSKAITRFMHASRTANGQGQAVRLEACAKDAVKFCGSLKDRCEAALSAPQ